MFKRDKKESYIRVLLKSGAWKRVPLKLLRWGRKMPSTAQYDLVPNDEYDMKIPLHPDQAFKYGITFHAKYIGTMDVPRPTSRVEIVAAMRRVRYEFKARKVKKRKVTMDISTEGVRVTSRRSKLKTKLYQAARFFTRKKSGNAECIEIMHHPIYRIFYVSHDSSDLKIFSYIARDGATNVFKCNVFKSNKKSQAMRIVRTVGQAFEVCHKMNINSPGHPAPSTASAVGEPVPSSSDAAGSKAPASDCGASESEGASTSKTAEDVPQPAKLPHLDLLPPPPRKENSRRTQPSPSPSPVVPTINLPDLPDLSADLPECVTKIDLSLPDDTLSTQHQVKLLREKLEQQAQQTRAAVAQLLLLRNQLVVEQTARCEAQARTHQLLVHNRELIDHIAALIGHLHGDGIESPRPINAQQLTMLPQADVGGKKEEKEASQVNGNVNVKCDDLISFFTENNNNKANNNKVTNNKASSSVKTSTTMNNIPTITTNGPSATLNFTGMTNEEIQEYLIAKFQDMGVNGPEPDPNTHKQFYQNTSAFPNIAPLTSHFSSTDLASLLNHKVYQDKFDSTEGLIGTQRGNIGQSQLSLCSSDSSSDSSSDNSSEDGVPYIMPLSHNGTLTATGDDGRIRLIVPVSPSESTSEVPEEPHPSTSKANASDNTLRVPEQSVASGSVITRSTSEKLSSSAKIDRWFSLLQTTPALSRPESGFVSGVEEGTDKATLADAKNLLLHLGVKKKKRILPLRFKRRVVANKHTML